MKRRGVSRVCRAARRRGLGAAGRELFNRTIIARGQSTLRDMCRAECADAYNAWRESAPATPTENP